MILNKIQDKIDQYVLLRAIAILQKDYTKCDTKDYDDFSELDKSINNGSRCYSCRIGEVIEFLKDYISLF